MLLQRSRFAWLPLLLAASFVWAGPPTAPPPACIATADRQTTGAVLMVSPDDFAFNTETAQSNRFQNSVADAGKACRKALAEFDGVVRKLRGVGVQVVVLPSRHDVKTPDAVFPNNWFSLHRTAEGTRVLVGYPMLAPNRRAERRLDLLSGKLGEQGHVVDQTIDLSRYEEQDKFLEGTGSMVLDRVHRMAYASLSPRTDQAVLDDFCRRLGFRPVAFRSYDVGGSLIYHTNVMMSVGESFAVVCLEAVRDEQERALLRKQLEGAGKLVVPITRDQMTKMCGNILELRARGRSVIVMSHTAYAHFNAEQKKALSRFGRLLPVRIDTIETIGGGSARCMLGEIF